LFQFEVAVDQPSQSSDVESDNMKKHLSRIHRSQLSLGDLILTVSGCSRNSREAAAAVANLLETGKVRLLGCGQHSQRRGC
jgi:hypothetical protein